jgi:hypothetical protein
MGVPLYYLPHCIPPFELPLTYPRVPLELTKVRTRRRVDRPNVSARPRTHARTGPRAVALDTYHWSGVVGNNTTLTVALAAGFGGAFALALVIGIVIILRNRQAARASDPATSSRTALYGE